jgi:hypothetical protein
MLNIKLLIPPASEPVSLSAVKQFLVVDPGFTDDDAVIRMLAIAARVHCENVMNRAIFYQSWLLTLDYFPIWYPTGTRNGTALETLLGVDVMRSQVIHLPWPSLASVTSITYIDTAGYTQTLDPSLYFVDTNSEPGRIAPMPGMTWPTTGFYQPGSVQITFVAGSFGDGNCPASIATAIQLLVSSWYASRSGTSPVNMLQIPFGVDVLLNPYKFNGWMF